MKTRFLNRCFALAGLTILLGAAESYAQAVPALVNYSASLTDSSGKPVSGTKTMTFRVFDDPVLATGHKLWEETQTVSVSSGVFSVQLGSAAAWDFSIFAGSSTYLEVQVGSDILSPRARLVASPYAANSKLLQGKDLGAFVLKDASGNVSVPGNLGIGTTAPAARLEVSGGVRVGNDAVACGASNAGEIIWTGTVLQVCTGSAWTTVSLPPAPVVTSAPTATGQAGSAFSYAITATNSPTSFGATGLPAGLTVNTNTGVVSGTPTTAGTASVTISASNAGGTGSATLALTINAPPPAAPVITSALTASGTVGSAFSYTITATNSPTSFGATALPAGLSVNANTGVISGTPTTTGTSNVTISATNAGGTGSATLTITIAQTYNLTVTLAGTGSGSVTSAPSGINCGSTCTSGFASGTAVTLTAAASSGSTFAGFSGGGCSGGGISTPYMWVPANSSAVTRLDTTNGNATTISVPVGSYAGAVDAAGNFWGAGYWNNAVFRVSPSGAVMGPFSVGNQPTAIAIDASGNVWVGNNGDGSITKLNGADGRVIGTYSVGNGPAGIAADASGNVWVVIQNANSVLKLNGSNGSSLGTFAVGSNPKGIAVDASGNVWVTNVNGNSVTELNGANGGVIGTYAVGSAPYAVAVDGSGNVWVANITGNNVTKLNGANGSVIGTYNVGAGPADVAVDGSGNIWVANSGSNNVTELKGSDGSLLGTFSASTHNLGQGGDVTGFALQSFVLKKSASATCSVTMSAAQSVTATFSAAPPAGGGTTQASAGKTCQTIFTAYPSSPSGVYWIAPDGIVANAFQVYCDMVTNGGGWTLVVGISASNGSHNDPASVTPSNLTSPTGTGKFADATINAIKSGTDPGIRFTCGSWTGFFPAACVFSARTDAAGFCTEVSYTYPPPSYCTNQFSQAAAETLADGCSNTTNNRLIYGCWSGSSACANGCDTGGGPGQGWSGSGTVWVR